MELEIETFDIKLNELNEEYSQIQDYISCCKSGDHKKIGQLLNKIEGECKENDLLLEDIIENSRSPLASDLAAAQLEYSNKIQDILRKGILDLEESFSLYGEYAIDYAIQTMRYAILAVLNAIDLQLRQDEKDNMKGRNNDE